MTSPTMTAESFTTMLTGLMSQAAAAVTANPVPFALVAGLIVLVLAARRAAATRQVPVDPSRLFSVNQRTEGFARAGGRCELEGWFFTRCKGRAHHGDHHYPHSRGGATSMANFVAACAHCNTSKGARIPTFWQTMRIEARRRKYFPQGISVKAGERFAQH